MLNLLNDASEVSVLDLSGCLESSPLAQSYCTSRESDSKCILYLPVDCFRSQKLPVGKPCVFGMVYRVAGDVSGEWKSMDVLRSVAYVYPCQEEQEKSPQLFPTLRSGKETVDLFCVSKALYRLQSVYIRMIDAVEIQLVVYKESRKEDIEQLTLYKVNVDVDSIEPMNTQYNPSNMYYIEGMLLETQSAWYCDQNTLQKSIRTSSNIAELVYNGSIKHCKNIHVTYTQEQPTTWLERVTSECKVNLDILTDIIRTANRYIPSTDTKSQNILLYGGSGSGKTFLASKLAHQSDLPYTLLDCSTLHSSTRGSASEELMLAFHRSKGGILVLDDIDSLRVFDGLQNLNELELLATLHGLLQSSNGPRVVLCTATDPQQVDISISTQLTIIYQIAALQIHDIYTMLSSLLRTNQDEMQKEVLNILEYRLSVCTPADLLLVSRCIRQLSLDHDNEITPELISSGIQKCGFVSSIRTSKYHARKMLDITYNDCLLNASSNQEITENPIYKLPTYNLVGLDQELTHVVQLYKSRPHVTTVLVTGEVGTGKSVFATTCASVLNLPVFNITAAELWQKQLGGTEESIASLFKDAAACAPCCIIVEKVETLLKGRIAYCLQQGLDSLQDKQVQCIWTSQTQNQIPYNLRQVTRIQKIVRMNPLHWIEKWVVLLQMQKHTPVQMTGIRATAFDRQWTNLRTCLGHFASHLVNTSLTSIRGIVTAACMNAVRETQEHPTAEIAVLPHDQLYGFQTMGVAVTLDDIVELPNIFLDTCEWVGPDSHTHKVPEMPKQTLEELLNNPILNKRCTNTEASDSDDSDVEDTQQTHMQQKRLSMLNKLRT